jgi:type VI secretion system protein ImpI
MKLVFELVDSQALQRGNPCGGVFDESGGVIGRDPGCAWSIEDRHRHISGRHAQVSWRDGVYWLTDISRNGTECREGELLRNGEATPIGDGDGFRFGGIVVTARLTPAAIVQYQRPEVPDLDPLAVAGEQYSPGLLFDDLSMLSAGADLQHQTADHTPVDFDHLLPPRLVAAPDDQPGADHWHAATGLADEFWQQLGEVLGVDLQAMDDAGREAVVLRAARLLRECVDGLQRTLRNRDDLEADIGCVTDSPPNGRGTALDCSVEAATAIRQMLFAESAGDRCGSVIGPAFRALQAQEVAMLAGARATARAALEHFSPQQLNWEFERDSSRPVLTTAGGRWRAYLRFHHALSRDPDWADDLLARHFTQAYRDQIRLMNTLHLESQG